ncbi:MAG TPA: protein kinase [Acidobacteriota bacterium]|nr:protein kinase [Acidobacteriota bacterium]
MACLSMALEQGSKLGPYEILSPLGAGGMGAVYKARDTRLGREVAVKVLPDHLVSDPDALARFQTEARAVASLSHPNVLGIFDFGQANSTVYAVMELLEGETLREKMRVGALPLRRTLDFATQIAHGLAAAHSKGIVHRDLKPDNVFITRDGRAKILDFGLAKRELKGVGTPEDPTATHHTEPGTVLGTAGYMSPEQVRGQVTDYRTDIFSYGSVLYEMLSGRPAFKRDTASDTLSAILRDDPPDVAESTRNVPPGLERIVRHCLEKDPERRFGSASDIAFDLETVSQASGTSSPQRIQTFRKKFRLQSLALLAAALLIPVAFFVGNRMVERQLPIFKRLTFARGNVGGARFAPDGTTIVYSAAWNGNPSHVYTSHPEGTGASALELPDAILFSLSSTGELALGLNPASVGSLYSTCTLARVPMTGGEPREIMDNVISADWSPDGSQLAAARLVGGKTRLEYPIGKLIYEKSGWISHIRISSDGEKIAFLDHPFSSDGGDVVVVDRNGKKQVLTTGWVSLEGTAWNPNGKEVWFTGTRIGAATKVYAVTLTGKERLVFPSPNELTLWDVSRDGRLLITEDDWRGEMSMMAPGADHEKDVSNFDYTLPRYISDDGKSLSFDDSGEGGGDRGATFIRRWNDSSAVRIGEGTAGGFSPDGKWIASNDLDGKQIVMYPMGVGQPKTYSCGDLGCGYVRFFPDGKHIAFVGTQQGHGTRLYGMDLTTQKVHPISPEGVAFITVLPISPDGNYVAGLGVDAKPAIFAADGGKYWTIPNTQEREFPAQWTPDGKSIYLTQRNGAGVKVFRVDVHTGARDLWKEINATDPGGVVGVTRVYPTPDGKGYAYGYIRILSTLFLVKGLR